MKDLSRDEFAAAGRWLTQLYEGRGFNRSRLAKESGVSVSTLQSLEAGGRINKGEWVLPNPSTANLYKLATVLDVSAKDLGARFGKTMADVTPPVAPGPVTVEGVAAEVRALRAEQSELREQTEQLLDRFEQLLDRLPPP